MINISAVTLGARRNDIDVLRAIAVLAVTFYHFDIPYLLGGLFQAGFLGVDIFFVISGYLITQQILANIKSGSFSLANFYAKRIRRLLPAFLVVLAGTALTTLWLMTPSQLERFNGSLTFTSLYISNFFFWQESGYFDSSSLTKPLLHTWSLSVEEQFYIFWPLFLLLFSNRKVWLWMLALFLLSLIAVELIVEKHSGLAFYLMPFRIFEFAIGGLIIPIANKAKTLRYKNTLAVTCLIIIFLSFSLITDDHSIPSIVVLPTLFATAIIIAMQASVLQSNGVIIQSLAWVGRISYSMYLVHWPLVVFYRMQFGEQLNFTDVCYLLLATLICTVILYYYFEQSTQKIQIKPMFWFALLLAGLVIAVLFSSLGNDFYKSQRKEREQIDQLLLAIPDRQITIQQLVSKYPEDPDGTKVLILGDSHTADLHYGLKLADAPKTFIKSLGTYCDPILLDIEEREIKKYYKNHPARQLHQYDCAKFHRTLLFSINRFNPEIIIFSERWRDEALPYVKQTISHIQNEMGIKVIVLGKNQEFAHSPDLVLANVEHIEGINQMAWKMKKDEAAINNRLKEIAEVEGVTYIDKSIYVCPTPDQCDYLYDGKLTYSDSNHWTQVGMRLFTQRIVDSEEFINAWSREK